MSEREIETDIYGDSGARYVMRVEGDKIVLYDAAWWPALTPLDKIPDKVRD